MWLIEFASLNRFDTNNAAVKLCVNGVVQASALRVVLMYKICHCMLITDIIIFKTKPSFLFKRERNFHLFSDVMLFK